VKADAAVNREHTALIVERNEGVDVAVGKEPAAEACAALVGGQAGRQHEADASPVACERQRAFGEELIPICVSL
jgi:hypothetical protein